MGRAPCCDKANVKRGPWSPEEDATLKSYLQKNGTGGNWIALPQKAGLRRCGKSCRLRWLNYLRSDIKHGGFTEEEDHIICSLYKSIGSRWSVIASHLPGRTDNDVKNHWNTKLKKRLFHSQQHQQNCNTVRTAKSSSQISTSPPIASPSLPAMKSESCSYFSGYSVPLICSEPLYQLPDFSGNTSGYILSPPTEDISAASSSSMTMENMGMGMMGSSTSSEFFDWSGLHGWIGEGEQDLIFGGNLWGGGYEGSGKAHDLYRSLSYS